jgi:hypothetical protein
MSNLDLLPQLSASFTIAANADFRRVIEFLQSDGSSPLDISGITFRMMVRVSADNAIALLDLSTDNGLLVNGGAAGTLKWAVPRALTSMVPPGPYIADILASDETGVVNLFQDNGPAQVTVNRGITRQ